MIGKSGAGWGIRGRDQAAKHLRKKVEQNLEAIQAVYEREKDYKSPENFKRLQEALRKPTSRIERTVFLS